MLAWECMSTWCEAVVFSRSASSSRMHGVAPWHVVQLPSRFVSAIKRLSLRRLSHERAEVEAVGWRRQQKVHLLTPARGGDDAHRS